MTDIDTVLTTLNDTLVEYFATNNIFMESNRDSTSISMMSARVDYISHLEQIHAILTKTTESIAVQLRQTKIVHSGGYVEIERFLDTYPTPSVRPKRRKRFMPAQDRKMLTFDTNSLDITYAIEPKSELVPIADVTLPAVIIDDIDNIPNAPLYYLPSSDKFAIKINNKMFFGNIGTIFTDTREISGVKMCKYKTNCVKKNECKYYHGGLDNINNKDIRNFVANSWLYTPPTVLTRQQRRKIGSRSYLRADLDTINDEDAMLFIDQATHDLLVALLL